MLEGAGYPGAMTSRRRRQFALVGVFTTLGTLSVLACLWVLWFLVLLLSSDEGALPPKWRIPDVPSGANIIEESKECGSGGCWRQITLTPAPGQSPEDLAEEMGLSEERNRRPTLFDPASVYVGAHPKGSQLIVYVGYQ
jgi:hypothetical protein